MCQNVSAYVSIRQHTSAYLHIDKLESYNGASAYDSIRQHTSAYVSTRQHASAYLHIDKLVANNCVSGLHVVKVNGHHLRAPPRIRRIRQHASAYAKHTSAYVSMPQRQHTLGVPAGEGHVLSALVLRTRSKALRQYVSFCTSKASSKLSEPGGSQATCRPCCAHARRCSQR